MFEAVITGTGLYRPPHAIANAELVEAFNAYVERFNRTLATEWAYRQPFTNNDERSAALGPWLDHYNNDRNHHGIGGKPPISRVMSPNR